MGKPNKREEKAIAFKFIWKELMTTNADCPELNCHENISTIDKRIAHCIITMDDVGIIASHCKKLYSTTEKPFTVHNARILWDPRFLYKPLDSIYTVDKNCDTLLYFLDTAIAKLNLSNIYMSRECLLAEHYILGNSLYGIIQVWRDSGPHIPDYSNREILYTPYVDFNSPWGSIANCKDFPHTCQCSRPGISLFTSFECSNPSCTIKEQMY